MRVFLSGEMGVSADLGWGWRQTYAKALEAVGIETAWPYLLRGTKGQRHRLQRLSEIYDQDPHVFIRGDVDNLLQSDGVLFRLNGDEGVGTAGELAIARWGDKPTVIIQTVGHSHHTNWYPPNTIIVDTLTKAVVALQGLLKSIKREPQWK